MTYLTSNFVPVTSEDAKGNLLTHFFIWEVVINLMFVCVFVVRQGLEHVGYLSSEQALADFVTLIDLIKSTVPGAAHSPVVAFGGSYGGMLAAWLRMKYPHSVIG